MSSDSGSTGSGSIAHKISSPFGAPQFLTLSGSRLYGIDTPTSDFDYVGAVVEPREYVVGLSHFQHQNGFEQFEFKGQDYEGSIYSLKKLVRMIAQGNPTTLCLMFAPDAHDDFGITSEEFRAIAISKHSGYRFLKYMEAQRKSMIGQRSKHSERLDLIEEYGFDTKFAGHLIRLGYQGREFLQYQNVTLPIEPVARETILSIRRGEYTEEEVLTMAAVLENEIQAALDNTTLPNEPNYDALNAWLVAKYDEAWSAS